MKINQIKTLYIFAIVLTFLLGTGKSLPAQTSREFSSNPSEVEISQRAMDATVFIRTKEGEGTGFFISEDGYILTNYSVIAGCDGVTISTRARQVYQVADIVSYSLKRNIALLKVPEKGFTFLEPETSSKTNISEPVYIVGHLPDKPWILQKTYVAGKSKKKKPQTFTFAANIAPETSGAAVVNKRGKVCAIATYMPRLRILIDEEDQYSLNLDEVSEIGIPSDFFEKIPTQKNHKIYPMSKVIEAEKKVMSVNYLAYLLDKTHENILTLKKHFSSIEINDLKSYNHKYKNINGSSKIDSIKISLRQNAIFEKISSDMASYINFAEKEIIFPTKNKNLDSAIEKSLQAAKNAKLAADKIVTINGEDKSMLVEHRNAALAAYNKAVSDTSKSLKLLNQILKKYKHHIALPLTSFSKLRKLEKTYTSGKLKATKSDFSI